MEHLSKNKIKWIRSLRLKKNRDAEDVFVVEGTKMIHELLSDWNSYIVLLCTSDESFKPDSECFFVEPNTMNDLSTLSTPSTLLAVVRKPDHQILNTQFTLAIDGVQDPGNMGTIIRTADWFGIDRIICSKETVDAYNTKVVQASMGSLFRVSIEYTDLKAFLTSVSLPIYGALLEGETIYNVKLEQNAVLVVGNEGNGISESIRECISHPVLIPGKGGAESLNVAVATGILLGLFSNQ